MAKYPVFLGRCESYSIEQIASIIKNAMEKIILNKPIAGFDGFVCYPIKKLKGWLVNLKR